MEIVTAISVSKSLVELGKEIAKVIEQAQKSPDVVHRVLYYLDAARTAVSALGIERQHILTDARRCDVSNPEQIEALWQRLDRYLNEDNIRPQLVNAIQGLRGCHEAILNETRGLWWRKSDKEAAVNSFLSTLNELEVLLDGLTYNFYPGSSGMGVQTLWPIFTLISRVREDIKLGHSQNYDVRLIQEELGELARQALRDKSHEDWISMGGKVEALVNELHLAFSVKKNNLTEP